MSVSYTHLILFKLGAKFTVEPKCSVKTFDVAFSRIEKPVYNLTFQKAYDFIPDVSARLIFQEVYILFYQVVQPLIFFVADNSMKSVNLCDYVDFSAARRPKL